MSSTTNVHTIASRFLAIIALCVTTGILHAASTDTTTVSGGTLKLAIEPGIIGTSVLRIDASTLATGTAITLTNMGTGGGTFTVDSGSVTVAADIKGRNALRFTGVNAFKSTDAYVNTGSVITTFSVASSAGTTSNSAWAGYLSFNRGGLPSNSDWNDTRALAALGIYTTLDKFGPFRNGGAMSGDQYPMPSGPAIPFITVQVFDGTNSTFALIDSLGALGNATPVASVGAFDIGATAIGGRLGGNNGLGNLWKGDVGEVIVFNDVLSESDKTVIQDYLKYKWFGIGPADMLDFGPGALIDGTNITWSVLYGTDVTSLAPTYVLSVGATCDIPSGTATDFTSPVVYTVVSADSMYTNVYTVTVIVAPKSSAKEMRSFGFPGNQAVIAGTAITLSVPYGTDRTTLAPTYTVSPLASGNPPSDTARDFTTPQTYTVTAEDMSTLDYTVTVNVRSDVQLTVTDGLIVWLKADAIDTSDPVQVRTSGSDLYVQQWNDLSGYGHVATNDIQSDQPMYIASALGGKPALRFAEVNNSIGSKLFMGDLSEHFPTGASLYAVATIDHDNRYDLFGNRVNDGRWVSTDWGNRLDPGTFRITRADVSSYFSLWPTSNSHIFLHESDSAVYRFVIDGTNHITGTPSYHSGSGTNWVIGNSVSDYGVYGGQQFRGDISEMILYDHVLSSNEASQVGAYLATKYGLTTAYPNNGPFVDVVNAFGTTNVPNGTTVFNVAGSNSATTIGTIWRTNMTSGGEFPANSNAWSFDAALSPGMNLITVSGSNAAGAVYSTWTRVNVVPEPAVAGVALFVIGYSLLVRAKRGSAS